MANRAFILPTHYTHFTDNPQEKFYASRNTALADYLFTFPAVIIQPHLVYSRRARLYRAGHCVLFDGGKTGMSNVAEKEGIWFVYDDYADFDSCICRHEL